MNSGIDGALKGVMIGLGIVLVAVIIFKVASMLLLGAVVVTLLYFAFGPHDPYVEYEKAKAKTRSLMENHMR